MPSEDLSPIALMFDVRERLARIETKMDNSAERFASIESDQEDHGKRIDALEKEVVQYKSKLAVFAGIGGLGITLLSVFGEKLLGLF
jgi:hypothetical protein